MGTRDKIHVMRYGKLSASARNRSPVSDSIGVMKTIEGLPVYDTHCTLSVSLIGNRMGRVHFK
jgi:hypothetical protein